MNKPKTDFTRISPGMRKAWDKFYLDMVEREVKVLKALSKDHKAGAA